MSAEGTRSAAMGCPKSSTVSSKRDELGGIDFRVMDDYPVTEPVQVEDHTSRRERLYQRERSVGSRGYLRLAA